MSLYPPLGFIPVCSLGMSQIGRMNLGKDASTLKYYTMCGLQEGFEPFAVNMNRDIIMWFSKRLPTFVNVPQDHMHIEVKKSILIFIVFGIVLVCSWQQGFSATDYQSCVLPVSTD